MRVRIPDLDATFFSRFVSIDVVGSVASLWDNTKNEVLCVTRNRFHAGESERERERERERELLLWPKCVSIQ